MKMVQCSSKRGTTKRTRTQNWSHQNGRLVVFAIETGGRWSEEAVNVFHLLAVVRSWEVPAYMSHQVAVAWERRWTRVVASRAQLRSQCRWWHLPGSARRSATQAVRHQACVICSLLTHGKRFMCLGWTWT